ncbi:predicted protein [Aspergillus terreus NIH2624]|uniref:Protein kinase domain-containing protein n=1 Tax=Aspergillus terreus (strain NIH 2624 / FGSC A1156) TaxID=341663 RepID=Q0CBP1_ASPTN|nr:uncharacterized protein ATEG_08893 [Aspergillus terreus NIH2624]EAU31025.1 predicted protein [Aspergillus terreus NIH2624]
MDPISAAGIAISVASLSFQVFAGCVKGFVVLSSAQNFGKDASFLRTMLNVEEYRFIQWADTVGLTSPGGKMLPQINRGLADELMVQLRDRLDCVKLRERYSIDLQPANLTSQAPDNCIIGGSQAPDILASAVSDERRTEILAHAKLIERKTGLPKRLWWVMIEKSKFQDLVRDLRQIVDALWNLLEPMRLRELVQQVDRTLTAVVDMSHDIDALKGVQASLSLKTIDFPGEANLSAAVGLKVMREQLPDDGSDPARVKSLNHESIRPLHRNLLKQPTNRQGNGGSFIAEYDGKQVLCEAKPVHGRLKSKLRLRSTNLANLLALPKNPGFLTLSCLGFLEDVDEFVFLYEYPPGADTSIQPRSLQDLLRDKKTRPPSVTARIRLALEICRTILTVHTAGWLHKNIRSENILFFTDREKSGNGPDALTQPYLTGFAFSRADSPVEISDQASEDPLLDIYRHPKALGEPSDSYAMYMDHYSLGMVLTEIAEWCPLKFIIKNHVDVTRSEIDVPLSALAGVHAWLVRELVELGRIEFRMGEVYGNAVSWLISRKHGELKRHESTERLLAFQQFVNELGCCRV